MAMTELGFVDPRGHTDFVRGLHARGFIPQVLSAGDVSFKTAQDDLVLIEYKRLYQFIADMRTGKMSSQTYKMAQEAPFPIILLEGRWGLNADGSLQDYPNITWQQIWDYMQTVQDSGLRFQPAVVKPHSQHAIERSIELYYYYAKGVHLSALRRRAGDVRLEVLCQIPGIKVARARMMLEKLGSLGAIADAVEFPEGLFSLQQVSGIGPKLAAQVREFFWANKEH